METVENLGNLYGDVLKYKLSEDEYDGLQGLPKSFLTSMFPELLNPHAMSYNFKRLWDKWLNFSEDTWSQENTREVTKGRNWILGILEIPDSLAFERVSLTLPAFTFRILSPKILSDNLLVAVIGSTVPLEIEQLRLKFIRTETVFDLIWERFRNPSCSPDFIITYEQFLLPAYLELLKLG